MRSRCATFKADACTDNNLSPILLDYENRIECNKKMILLYCSPKKHETTRQLGPDIDGNILPCLVKKIPL